VLDLSPEDVIRGQPDGVAVSLCFQILIDPWIGEGRIAPEKVGRVKIPVAGDDGLEQHLPVLRAVDIPLAEHGAFKVAERGLVRRSCEHLDRAAANDLAHRGIDGEALASDVMSAPWKASRTEPSNFSRIVAFRLSPIGLSVSARHWWILSLH
jgi:hypothetical protein